MNRRLFLLLFFVLSMLSQSVFAATTCNVTGNHDFVVQFQVVGSTNYQQIALSGGNETDILWYTEQERSLAHFVFNEQGLTLGQTYTIRIEIDRAQGNKLSTAHYYWVENGVTVLKQTKSVHLHNGALDGTGTGISDLQCGDSVELPPIDPPDDSPDQCDVFPNVVQSWGTSSVLNVSNGGAYITGTADGKGFVGFSSVSNGGSWQRACDSNRCQSDPSLLIAEPAVNPLSNAPFLPFVTDQTLSIPEGRYDVIDSGGYNTYTMTGKYYEINTLLIQGSAKFIVQPDTFIKVNNFTILGSSSITSAGGGKAEDLIIWAEDESNKSAEVTVSVNTSFNANIFSRGTVSLTGGAVLHGSITAHTIDMNGTGIERTEDTCNVTPPPTNDYSLSLSPLQGIQLTCTAQPLDFQVKDSSGNDSGAYAGNIIVNASGGSNSTFSVVQGSFLGGNQYKANNNGLLRLNMDENTVSNVVVTSYLEDDTTGTTAVGNYKFVAYKLGFSPNPTNVIAGKTSTNVSVQPLECLNNAPVVSSDYNGVKQVELLSTKYHSPLITSRPGEVINVNGTTTPHSNVTVDFGSNSTANINVSYAEAGSASYVMQDEICINDSQGGQECRTYEGEHQIQSRPWTFALCEPNNSDISGTSKSGSFFKYSGQEFTLNAIPIKWVSGNTAPNDAIDVSNYCNQLDSLETKNFYSNTAPAVSVSLSAELDTPSGGTLGSGLEGVPPTGIANDSKASGPVQFTDLLWKEAGSIKISAGIQNDGNYLFEPINKGYRTVGRFSPHHLAMLDENDTSPSWTQWDYLTGLDNFAYMSQEFPHTFKVQAQAVDGTPTTNYGLFNDSLITSLSYIANTLGQASNVSLTNRISGSQTTWSGADWPKRLSDDPSILSVTISDFSLMKKVVSSTGGSYIATEEDGPYDRSNSIFGLQAKTIVDKVDFSGLDIEKINSGSTAKTYVGKSFPNQPEFRYGRMKLNDVGGNSGQTLRVPLKVEYWDGGAFVTNKQDNASTFLAANRYCIQTIWNNQSTAATDSGLLSNGGVTVVDGASDELYAEHNPISGVDNERAQVRLWLSQGTDSPQRHENDIDCSKATSFTNQPWLQYNWRNKGDEDPSAVVTFGVFRGNDRVIFRGERALIGH
ncbi:DUF6701 domain-containing protein [Vibrio rarus]|uniref:DUF6701 domain-containing protein n=1 Tax=Vibrio rarus TaxID=413403 RepID=UPI0021C4BDE7|nr:DUF6701 domain-containing protein [Vibrio rarus]